MGLDALWPGITKEDEIGGTVVEDGFEVFWSQSRRPSSDFMVNKTES